jgi:hypothetical protein
MRAHKLTPSDLTPGEADDFIRELRDHQGLDGRVLDADSVRLVISVASSFLTFLERRDATLKNPFRGTKARPHSTWPVATIPTKEELIVLICEAHPVLAAALAVAAETGLRVGALPGLSISVCYRATTTIISIPWSPALQPSGSDSAASFREKAEKPDAPPWPQVCRKPATFGPAYPLTDPAVMPARKYFCATR